MKKALIIVAIFIIFLILYFLQSNFFDWFNIAGIKPNTFIILVLIVGLFGGKIAGCITGAILGIILDFFISKNVGITAIMLSSIGFFGGAFEKNFSKDSKLTIMLVTMGASFVYELGVYLINAGIYQIQLELITFIKIILIECLYNGILVIIFYPIIVKFGNYMKEQFNRKNILTKYF